jgi:YidC/Oxa1 family membrane protein insertase
MKKNWIIILACLGFILGWDMFVVRPYYAKHKPAVSAVADTNKVAEGLGAVSTAVASTPFAPAAVGAVAVHAMTEEDAKNALVVRMSAEREVKVYPDLSIGNAVFRDYFVRGSGEKAPVVLARDNFRWSSTSPDVQACLNGLFQGALSTDNLARHFETPKGSCSSAIQVDAEKPGLLHVKLGLHGFDGSQGAWVEFKSTDVLGQGPAADHNQLGYKIDNSRAWVRGKDLFEEKKKEGKLSWFAWGDKYFISALLPRGAYNPNVVWGPAVPGKSDKVAFGLQYPIYVNAQGESAYELSTYFGVRDSRLLSAVDPVLDDAVDLGFFGAIAKVLIWALKSLNVVFRNYGFSIIALTLLVRAAFWPLNRKVFTSSLKMKKLQPQIDAIRKKYGEDKSKLDQMNRELLNLYKVHKVNPVGSCLPMLLQLPIFIGLYAALNHSIDLYQAPFFGWIQDLSWKDPFFVFPALWTLSLLAYMKLNPQNMNPQPGQPDMKWIMIAMNLFFGYLSKDWPAGLTLYLFVSNLVGVIQQLMLSRDPKLQPVQEGA